MASRIDIPAGHVIVGARGGFIVPVQTNGVPLDVSAWFLKCTIRKGPEPDDEEVVSITSTSGPYGEVTVINGPQGAPNAIKVDFTPQATEGPVLDRGTYYYTIRRLDVGNEYAIAYGSIELDMSAVRS